MQQYACPDKSFSTPTIDLASALPSDPTSRARLAVIEDYLLHHDTGSAGSIAATVVLRGGAWLDLWRDRGRVVALRAAHRDAISLWGLWSWTVLGFDPSEMVCGPGASRHRVARVISTARLIADDHARPWALCDSEGFAQALTWAMDEHPAIAPRWWSLAAATTSPPPVGTTLAEYIGDLAAILERDDSARYGGASVAWRLVTQHTDVASVLRAARNARVAMERQRAA